MAGNSAASNKTIVPFLVCFAVKEEAKYFVPAANGRTEILITGMGQKNAKEGVERALNQFQPGTVITAGFAGGLNPALHLGAVVFDAGRRRPRPLLLRRPRCGHRRGKTSPREIHRGRRRRDGVVHHPHPLPSERDSERYRAGHLRRRGRRPAVGLQRADESGLSHQLRQTGADGGARA